MMTQGELIFYVGIAFAVIGLVILLAGIIGCGIHKSKVKKKMYQKYGF